jgi:hypothetical protein
MAVPEVAQRYISLGPGGLLAQLVDDVGLGDGPEFTRFDPAEALFVHVQQVTEQAGIHEVHLGSPDRSGQRIARPRPQPVDQKDRIPAARCSAPRSRERRRPGGRGPEDEQTVPPRRDW